MSKQKAEDKAEEAIFHWYCANQGEHDMLSSEALESLKNCIAFVIQPLEVGE